MILTGKAKEDFIKTKIGNEISLFESMLPIYSNALIIDFFDSVGIYIEVIKEDFGFAFNLHKGDWKNPIESIGHWEKRNEATIEGIKKANEIYNEKK